MTANVQHGPIYRQATLLVLFDCLGGLVRRRRLVELQPLADGAWPNDDPLADATNLAVRCLPGAVVLLG